MNVVIAASCIFLSTLSTPAVSSQIGALGSSFEAKLTKEPESSLMRVAGRLGVLIKSPVHEEITQLGFGCTADTTNLLQDTSCAGRDGLFATPYVIYGVRWNDLPPFRLLSGEGQQCKTLITRAPACRIDQTVRFSTQPECWLCLFKDAERTAQTKSISGCGRGAGVVRGNLMTRSHFGDLQFLHSMSSEQGISAVATQAEVLDWIQFSWKVFTKKIGPETLMRDVDIPTLKNRFGCNDLNVADVFILGRNDSLRPMLHHIAFGSILHVVQDSFSAAHAEREPAEKGAMCAGSLSDVPKPGLIREFHTYGSQDGHLHDLQDERSMMAENSAQRWPDAIEMTRALFKLYDDKASWDEAAPYFECIFGVSANSTASSAGAQFRRQP